MAFKQIFVLDVLKLMKIYEAGFLCTNAGLLKRKKPSYLDHAVKAARTKVSKAQLRSMSHILWVLTMPFTNLFEVKIILYSLFGCNILTFFLID